MVRDLPPGTSVRTATTGELSAADVVALRGLFSAAWPSGGDPDEAFDDDDFAHAMGGRHWLAELDGRIVSHVAVVERRLEVDGTPLRTGYLEAVATLPAHEGRGLASHLVRQADTWLVSRFELGGLATGSPGFYERLGWQLWQGPTWVRGQDGGLARTDDADGAILVLRTATTPALEVTGTLACDWRAGDVW